MTVKFINAYGVDAPPKDQLPEGTAWHDGKMAHGVTIGVDGAVLLTQGSGSIGMIFWRSVLPYEFPSSLRNFRNSLHISRDLDSSWEIFVKFR